MPPNPPAADFRVPRGEKRIVDSRPDKTPFREREAERNADFVYKGFAVPAETTFAKTGIITIHDKNHAFRIADVTAEISAY